MMLHWQQSNTLQQECDAELRLGETALSEVETSLQVRLHLKC